MTTIQYFSSHSTKYIQEHEGSIKLKWRHLVAEQLSTLFSNDIPTSIFCNNMEIKQGYITLSLPRIQRYLTMKPWSSYTTNDVSNWIISKFVPGEWIEKIKVVGSFVNFKVQKLKYMESILQQIIIDNTVYGLTTMDSCQPINNDGRNHNNSNDMDIMITLDLSFSTTPAIDPNHFRALILGHSLKRIEKNKAHLVSTLSIWNPEFGYLALVLKQYEDRIKTYDDLIRIYLKIKEADNDTTLTANSVDYSIKIEQGHSEAISLYQKIENLYQQHYQQLCNRLGFYFDSTICALPWEIGSFYQLLEEKCDKLLLLRASDSKEWKINLYHIGLDTPLIRDKKGLSTPLARNSFQLFKQYQTAIEKSSSSANDVFHKFYHITEQSRNKFVQQVYYIVFNIILNINTNNLSSSSPSAFTSEKCTWINIPIGMVNNNNNNGNNNSNNNNNGNNKSTALFDLMACLNSSQQIMKSIMEENKGTEKYDMVMAQLSQLAIDDGNNNMRTTVMLTHTNANNNGSTAMSSSSSIQHLAEKHADQLGQSALFIHYLSQKRSKPFITFFQLSESDIYGNSGVFLQYVHARVAGIQRHIQGRLDIPCDNKNNNNINTKSNSGNEKILYELYQYMDKLYQSEAFDIIDLLGHYPSIVYQAKINLDPSTLVHYLFKLARLTNQTLYNMRIKDVALDIAQARWLLFWAVKRILANGLIIIGVEPLEWM